MPYHAGSHQDVPGSVSRQRKKGEVMSMSIYCVFQGKGQAKQGKQVLG